MSRLILLTLLFFPQSSRKPERYFVIQGNLFTCGYIEARNGQAIYQECRNCDIVFTQGTFYLTDEAPNYSDPHEPNTIRFSLRSHASR